MLDVVTRNPDWLPALLLLLPLSGLVALTVVPEKRVPLAALSLFLAGLLLSIALIAGVLSAYDAFEFRLHRSGMLPLGLLRADGMASAMLLCTAVILFVVCCYLVADGRTPATKPGSGARPFWLCLFGLWFGLGLVFLSTDLLTLYVGLEIVMLSMVPLLGIFQGEPVRAPAQRFLVMSTVGSVFTLCGMLSLLLGYGTLEFLALSQQPPHAPYAQIAVTLITIGLFFRAALFPVHTWLPAAHAGASAPASALLSTLVVTAAFIALVRIWVDAQPGVGTATAGQLLGVLGACAILLGSLMALRQEKLKTLVAYSTVAQLGFLLLTFPLASATRLGETVWTGGILQAISHAVAKAAMALAVGLVIRTIGHDRISELGGLARSMPLTVFAFAAAGMSLMGLPPSGGFVAKWLLLRGAIEGGQWWWGIVIISGGLLTGSYLYRVVSRALWMQGPAPVLKQPIDRRMECLVLALALISILIGLLRISDLQFVHIGREW